jgi:uncharacterized protein
MSLDLVGSAFARAIIVPLISIFTLSGPSALAIDCTRVRTPAEVIICSDPEARSCDRDMTSIYESLRHSLPADQFEPVRVAQRAWIAERNAGCGGDTACVRRHCRERLAILANLARTTERNETQLAPATAAGQPTREWQASSEVPLLKSGGVYTVPVKINGALTLDFVVDSGAAEVNIPADVVMTLVRAKTIALSDFLPGARYVLADGTAVESARFTIRTMQIGNRVVENAAASIGQITSQLLLGQTVLEQLGRWSLDTRRGVMVLGDSGLAAPSQSTSRQQFSLPQQTGAGLPDGVPFQIGTSRDEVRSRLGSPSFEQEFGYWTHTTVDRFDDVVPQWLTLSYIYDAGTLRVRQAEAAFASWPGLDVASRTVSRMAGRSATEDARRALVSVGEGGARKATFKVGSVEGTIERKDPARIFIAVWEPGTHRR